MMPTLPFGIAPDQVVAFFEAGSAIMITKSVLKLHRERLVRGVSAWPICFFGAWGWWNIFWYSYINAPWAWWCGLGVVASNTTWALQILYWQHVERRRAELIRRSRYYSKAALADVR